MRRNANKHFAVWEERTQLVKAQVAAESAANDAKTVRLRAMRLAKEAQDAENAEEAEAAAPKRVAKKRLQRINCG